MARKMMTKEITKTTIKLSKVENVDGTPQMEQLPDEVVLGSITLEKATRQMRQKHGETVVVFGIEPSTQKYELPVETFLEHAKPVTTQETLEV